MFARLIKRFRKEYAVDTLVNTYHIRCLPLSQQTGWDDRLITVKVFPKSANQPNEIVLAICNSISRDGCFRLMRDWKLENLPNGKKHSVVLFRKKKKTTSVPLTFNRNFQIFFAKW